MVQNLVSLADDLLSVLEQHDSHLERERCSPTRQRAHNQEIEAERTCENDATNTLCSFRGDAALHERARASLCSAERRGTSPLPDGKDGQPTLLLIEECFSNIDVAAASVDRKKSRPEKLREKVCYHGVAEPSTSGEASENDSPIQQKRRSLRYDALVERTQSATSVGGGKEGHIRTDIDSEDSSSDTPSPASYSGFPTSGGGGADVVDFPDRTTRTPDASCKAQRTRFLLEDRPSVVRRSENDGGGRSSSSSVGGRTDRTLLMRAVEGKMKRDRERARREKSERKQQQQEQRGLGAGQAPTRETGRSAPTRRSDRPGFGDGDERKIAADASHDRKVGGTARQEAHAAGGERPLGSPGNSERSTEAEAAAAAPPTDGMMSAKEVDTIVARCFQSFLAEAKEFRENDGHRKPPDFCRDFASFLTEKYLVQSLDRLPFQTESAKKARGAIKAFIDRCCPSDEGGFAPMTKPPGEPRRAEPARGGGAPWACLICGKWNEFLVSKCGVCGRRRGYSKVRPGPSPVPVPIKRSGNQEPHNMILGGSEHSDVAGDERKDNGAPDCRDAGASGASKEERKENLFLKGKLDYEADSREELAGDIGTLLASVRANMNKPAAFDGE